MKMKFILIGIFCMILLAENVAAENPYGKNYTYDVYYNDKLLPGTDVAKPILKIGEPFKVKINLTLNQKSILFLKVCSLRVGTPYEVIEGPSKFDKKLYFESLDPGTYTFEWTLKPTGEWKDGTMPVNIWYQIHNVGEDEPLVLGEFTVAYPYISNEYYKGENPTSKEQTTSKTEPSSTSKTASMPAFSLVTAIAVLAFVFFRFSRH